MSFIKIYYIYTLTCPIDNVVRYVGCTINPKARLSSHLFCRADGIIKKRPWIDRLQKLGLIPIMKIVKKTRDIGKTVDFETEIYNMYNSEHMISENPQKRKYIHKGNTKICGKKRHKDGLTTKIISKDSLINIGS